MILKSDQVLLRLLHGMLNSESQRLVLLITASMNAKEKEIQLKNAYL